MSENSPFLGILKVNSKFDRPSGDVACLQTWEIPVKVKTVENSSVYEVVETSTNYSQSFIDGWVDAAAELIDEGAVAIVTSCGFLATIHPLLREKFPGIVFGTSALLQISIASNLIHPKKRIGVVTFNGDVLCENHLKAVGADPKTPIVGVEKGCSFEKMINCKQSYDYEEHIKDLVKASNKLINDYENIGGIVLECANMAPFRHAIKKATGLPVWDIVTLGNYVYEVGVGKEFR